MTPLDVTGLRAMVTWKERALTAEATIAALISALEAFIPDDTMMAELDKVVALNPELGGGTYRSIMNAKSALSLARSASDKGKG